MDRLTWHFSRGDIDLKISKGSSFSCIFNTAATTCWHEWKWKWNRGPPFWDLLLCEEKFHLCQTLRLPVLSSTNPVHCVKPRPSLWVWGWAPMLRPSDLPLTRLRSVWLHSLIWANAVSAAAPAESLGISSSPGVAFYHFASYCNLYRFGRSKFIHDQFEGNK